MQATIVPGVSMWSAWQPDRNLFFNSFFVQLEGGNLAIDPLALSDEDAAEIEARGGLAAIAITNRDHERAARGLATRFGAQLVASATDTPLLSGPVDRMVNDGDDLCGAQVVGLDGLKTAGEFALHFPKLRTIVVGDALWGDPAGTVRLMPDRLLADPVRAVLSLRALRARLPEHLLLGDGACLFGNAHRAIWEALEKRPEAYVNRINRDEASWRTWSGGPPGYGGRTFEIGDSIGAERLGYRLVSLPPKLATCPLHWHAAEEELFVVMTGAATLVTPRGEVALRMGDYVSFPTRASGAHKIVNHTNEPCEILMVANTDTADVCSYPDSRKVLIKTCGLMLRDHPVLDYFDGE